MRGKTLLVEEHMKKQTSKKQSNEQPTQNTSGGETFLETIICPHCQLNATVSAKYSKVIVKSCFAPVIFIDGQWYINDEYEVIDATAHGADQLVKSFICDKCGKEIIENDLNAACEAVYKVKTASKS